MRYTKILMTFLSLLLLAGCLPNRLYTNRKLLLGTIIEVTSPYPEAAEIALKEIERVEKVFSAYRQDSVITHLNKNGFLNTNFEVAFLIERAREFYNLTDGKFDITIGPLTKIWKDAFQNKKLPLDKDIREAQRLVGFDKIHVDKESNSIKLKERGVQLDLGGIAKGYAVDAAVKELKRKGIDSAIIDAGGDIYCLGTKFGQPWKVGIQHPRIRNALYTTIEVSGIAVVTSGDYEQYMEIGSKRYSHIIDPQTGYPIDNDILSVTVVAKDTTTADAVATCVFLLGKDKGEKVFKNYDGVEKIVVITEGDLREE